MTTNAWHTRLLMPLRYAQVFALIALFAMTILWELQEDYWDGPEKGML